MKHSLSILLLVISICPVFGTTTAENDTLLRVLQEELMAEFDELQKQDVKPYFMSFRVQESYTANIVATFGFLGVSTKDHKRLFTPQIRVGTPELDNFKFGSQSGISIEPLFSDATPNALPFTDAEPDALRSTIWIHMLNAYDRATSAYRNAQNRLRTRADNEDKAPCFSVKSPLPNRGGDGGGASAETYYEAPLPHPILTSEEQRDWEQRLCRISAAFRRHPQFNDAKASLQVENLRTHLVNTEGTAIVQNRSSYRVFLQAEVKTDDGMTLPLHKTYFATCLDSLPDESIILCDAEELGQRLEALANAPLADPFTGPALMSGEASGVFFHEIFGHRLEGHRMKSGGQTFRKMVGERVLPAEFQVYCDPTLTHYGTQPLNGGYVYDDEGTRARRVNNVVDGILKEFLMSRVPLDSFPESNGHGRTAGGGTPVSRQSNLVVETRKPYTEAQLRQFLRDEAQQQGKEYGYLFQSVSGGYTQTGEGNSINSFNVNPLEVYRIYVDGRPDELVRGVDLIGTPLSMFSNIAAGGDTPSTFIGMCGAESGWVPVSATSPMLYCSKIETQRRQQKGYLRPKLAAPRLTGSPSALPILEGSSVSSSRAREGAESSIIFAALSDELRRSMDSLRIEGQPAPFIIDYRLQRTRTLNMTATLGELSEKELKPWQQKFDAEVIVGDYRHTSQSNAEPDMRGVNIPMAMDYDNLRRQAWLATDARYKQAIAGFERKEETRQKTKLPSDEAALADLLPVQPATSILHRSAEIEDLHADELEAYVRRLSLVAREFPELTYSNASCHVRQADIYRLTSEGVRVAQPQDNTCEIVFNFHLYHNTRGHNNNAIQNHVYLCATEALADSARFTRSVRKYIRQRLDLLQAETVEDYYVGPVLFESRAGRIIYEKTSGNHKNFRAWHPYNQSDRTTFVKMNRKIIDDKISMRQDPSLSSWDGKPLVGYFTADANGQKPNAVTLIDHGIFCGQLCGVTSSLSTDTPTGNLRFKNPASRLLGAGTAPGVIRIESSKTIPLKKMRKQLLRDAQRYGYNHAYIVRPGSSALVRVNVKDGNETLLKMPKINVTLNNLLHISALSSEQQATIFSEDVGARFSIVAPQAMLLNDIEIPAPTPEKIAAPTLTFPLQRVSEEVGPTPHPPL